MQCPPELFQESSRECGPVIKLESIQVQILNMKKENDLLAITNTTECWETFANQHSTAKNMAAKVFFNHFCFLIFNTFHLEVTELIQAKRIGAFSCKILYAESRALWNKRQNHLGSQVNSHFDPLANYISQIKQEAFVKKTHNFLQVIIVSHA